MVEWGIDLGKDRAMIGSSQESQVLSIKPSVKDRQDLEIVLKELQQENDSLRTAYASLTQRLIGLRMLQNITQELVSELDVDLLLKRIMCSAINAVEGTAGSLLLLDPSRQELVFSVVEGGGGIALEGQRMSTDQGLAGWAVTHNEPLIVADVQQDERFFEQIPEGVDFEVSSQICVPLVNRGEVIGVVQVLNKAHGNQFNDDDLDLLTSFAAQSAAAIENTRLYQDLRRERDRLIATEEEVRRRLARDLHDGPAQLLAALITNIDFGQRLIEHQPELMSRELSNMRPIAEKALRQVRTLLFDLRPVILETKGLAPALEAYVSLQEQATDLSPHLQVDGFSGRLVASAERAIFGIVQEAVGNVRKHANAQNLWISVAEDNGNLMVKVRDDGKGFDADALSAEYDQRGSLGMLNMRERAEDLGGRLSLHSELGKGTTVVLTAPLNPLRATEAA
jgi:signal transduction histidine kinase